MKTINTLSKLSDVITTLLGGRQRTQLVNSAGTEIGTAAAPVTVTAGGVTSVIDVTFSGNSAAYVAGDVIGATQTLTNAMRINGGTGILQSIRLLDQDDLAQAIDVVIFQNTQSLGTDNAAVDISDANAIDKLGHVSITAADYIDLINSRSATKTNTGLGVQSAATSRDLFVGLILRGTGTYTPNALRLRMTFLSDVTQ